MLFWCLIAIPITIIVLDITIHNRYSVYSAESWMVLFIDMLLVWACIESARFLQSSSGVLLRLWVAISIICSSGILFLSFYILSINTSGTSFFDIDFGISGMVLSGFCARVILLIIAVSSLALCFRLARSRRTAGMLSRAYEPAPVQSPVSLEPQRDAPVRPMPRAPNSQIEPFKQPGPSDDPPAVSRLRRRLRQLEEGLAAKLITREEFDTRKAQLIERHGPMPELPGPSNDRS